MVVLPISNYINQFLAQDVDSFIQLAEELADALAGEEVEYTVGDAIEGYNPAHDICHLIINAAAEILRRRRNRSLASFDFLLAGAPDTCPAQLQDRAIRLSLNDGDFKRKLNAALSYPDLLHEVQSAFDAAGPDAFRVECLRPVSDSVAHTRWMNSPFTNATAKNRWLPVDTLKSCDIANTCSRSPKDCGATSNESVHEPAGSNHE